MKGLGPCLKQNFKNFLTIFAKRNYWTNTRVIFIRVLQKMIYWPGVDRDVANESGIHLDNLPLTQVRKESHSSDPGWRKTPVLSPPPWGADLLPSSSITGQLGLPVPSMRGHQSLT